MSKLKLKDDSFEWIPFITREQFERRLEELPEKERLKFYTERPFNFYALDNDTIYFGDIVIKTSQGWKYVSNKLVDYLFDMAEYKSSHVILPEE